MVCPCLYPIVFVDNRDGDVIKYISIPAEVLKDEGHIESPEFEKVKEKGFDDEFHEYMGVIWKDPKNAFTKKYDVNDHIVVAGCDAKTDGKKMKCKKKELFAVLHPIDEWKEHHVIKIQ